VPRARKAQTAPAMKEFSGPRFRRYAHKAWIRRQARQADRNKYNADRNKYNADRNKYNADRNKYNADRNTYI
jgi:hypothetical protein